MRWRSSLPFAAVLGDPCGKSAVAVAAATAEEFTGVAEDPEARFRRAAGSLHVHEHRIDGRSAEVGAGANEGVVDVVEQVVRADLVEDR